MWDLEHRTFVMRRFYANAESGTQTQRDLCRHFNVPPRGPIPDRNTILRWIHNVNTTGSLMKKKPPGPARTVRTPETVDFTLTSQSNTSPIMTDSDVVDQVAAPTPSSPKKSKVASKKKSGSAASKKPTHPPTCKMVVSAITALKERGGSSNQAIKKYISTTYKIDAEKLAPFIKKYLKSAVASGTLLQTKGKGASGSFKLAKASSEGAPTKMPTTKKAGAEKKKKTKTPAATPKKAVNKKKVAAPNAKKTTKTPTKPKVPKAKKTTTTKKASTVKKTTVKKSPAKPKKAAAKKTTKK